VSEAQVPLVPLKTPPLKPPTAPTALTGSAAPTPNGDWHTPEKAQQHCVVSKL
jgi:hypothetical protein